MYIVYVGAIKTGCLKTPAKNSRFCAPHKPRAIDTPSSDSAANSYDNGTSVAEFITAKRVTITTKSVNYMYLVVYVRL